MRIIYFVLILMCITSIASALPTKGVVNPYTGQLQLLTNTSILGTSALAFSTCMANQSSNWNGSYLNCINISDNDKVNKSGDNLTGMLNINPKNYSNDFDYTFDNSAVANTSYKSSQFNKRNFFIQQTFSNESTNIYNGFGAWKYGYNLTYNTVFPLKANELIYAFFAGGYAGSDNGTSPVTGMSGGVMGILFYTGTTAWNSTNKPAKVILYSNKPNNAGLNMMTLDETGNLTVPTSGSGNVYYCKNKTSGLLYEGTPTC